MSKVGKDTIEARRIELIVRKLYGPLRKAARAYFVKCDGIESLSSAYCNGGVSVYIRQKRSDDKGGRTWNFPEHKNFLSGTTDWIPQVFEFETDESWREQPETLVYLQTRYAAGVAHFDDVRLDKISK